MPGRHRPGYQAEYQAARKRAIRRLIEAHPEEWERYLTEERQHTTNDA